MNAFKKLKFSKDGIGAVLLKIDSDDVTVVVDKVRRRPCLAANNAVSCSSESKRQRAVRQRHTQTARTAQRTRGVGKSGHVSKAKGDSNPNGEGKAQRRGRWAACAQVMPTASLEDVADELDDVNPRYPRRPGPHGIAAMARSARYPLGAAAH